MIGKTLLAITVVLASSLLSVQVHAADAKAVSLGNFENPVYVTTAPGEPDLLFVVERPGVIRVLRNEHRLSHPFLNIRDLVLGVPDAGAGNEQGLLSMAFPPDYAQSRRFYVAFTNNNGSVEIDEFKRSRKNNTRADRTTRRTLLVIPHSGAKNHNGGQLQFDKDGLLYISVGDGGGLSPPGEPARNLSSLLGKILRIDPLPRGNNPYGIPPNNPFVGEFGRNEIFAYGLRHPWRFSIDAGIIAIGDVGETQREEVNFLKIEQVRGANFGWPQYEGSLVFDNARPGADPPKFPIFEYNHSGGNCAIIGGHVVRHDKLKALKGRYIYGDTCTGDIASFFAHGGIQTISGHRSAGITLPGLSSFGKGHNGKVYTTQIGGQVSRLAPP